VVIEQQVGISLVTLDFVEDLGGELADVFRVTRAGHRV
jgi:hypothetical protein